MSPMANGRCRLHGGMTPSGPASANWKHGRYSREFPTRMRDRVMAAIDDPELTSVRLDLATVDVLIGDALKGITDGGSGALWRSLLAEWGRYEAAARDGNVQRMRATLERIRDLIAKGAADADARDEVARRIDDRRRLLDHEVRREAAQQESITAAQGYALVGALVGIIQRYVTDPDAIAQIQREIRALTGSVAIPMG